LKNVGEFKLSASGNVHVMLAGFQVTVATENHWIAVQENDVTYVHFYAKSPFE
jgi:hypothetical protein